MASRSRRVGAATFLDTGTCVARLAASARCDSHQVRRRDDHQAARTLPTGTAGTFLRPSRSLPARRGHLFFSAAPPWFPDRLPSAPGSACGTPGPASAARPAARWRGPTRQQAGGPGGAALDADEEARQRDLPDLVRFFIATGERRGEALGAHWRDFDEHAKTLTMTGNLVQVRGKGAVRNRGKTETSSRSIPLPDWCVRMLVERRDALGDVDPDGPIFTNTRGGYLNASNLTNRYWVPFRKRAGYEWVTFHTFRKTVGTLLDDAGLTARQIADVLGHSHPSMTLNNYMGRGLASRASAVALDSVFVPRSK